MSAPLCHSLGVAQIFTINITIAIYHFRSEYYLFFADFMSAITTDFSVFFTHISHLSCGS
jgi:hypothetical protein